MASSKWARQAAKLYGRLYKVSIKQRVRLAFMLMIVLAIAAVGFSSYAIAARELQKNAFATRQEAVNKTAQILDEKLYQISNAVRSIMFSDAYKQMMTDVRSNRIADYYIHLSELQYVFSQVGYNEPLIDGILIATPIGDFYPISHRRSQTQSFYESNLYYDIKNLTGGMWIAGHSDKFFSGNDRAISFVTRGMADDDSDTNVFIVVNVNESGLIATLNRHAADGGDPYFIADANGEEVMRTDWSAAHGLRRDEPFLRLASGGQGSFFYDFDKSEYLVNYSRSSVEPDWLLYGVQEKSELLSQMKGVQRTTLAYMGIFLLLAWLLSSRLTGLLLLPLFKLQRLMREVEDNRLDVRFASRSADEIAQVGHQFNRMLDEINRLIRDVRDSESSKRKAEMRALTSQMEPHFLYNTLNTIYCKSVLGENEDVNEMIMALSQMFQLGLSGGKDWNTLEDELSHVRQYCSIQQKCYEGLFEYEASCSDETLMGCPLPKILLQPIVENSIQHGFKDRSSGGRIRIKADREDGLLHLTIEDNGSGFDAEKVKQGMQLSRNAKKGYALVNIRERLRLFYGDDARMALSNAADGGARTDLWIPIGRTEGEGDERE